MNYKIGIILLTCYFIAGCSDYASGYKDGYENSAKKQWIVFGGSNYLEGFQNGEAEKFQDEWFVDNLTDMNQLQCSIITVRADPLTFLPSEYERVGPDTYKVDFQ
ncbi:MAG: hypothetical protein ACI9ZT_000962 [Gammaproteobacteria bacterium]|jgi:hypothetical protein